MPLASEAEKPYVKLLAVVIDDYKDLEKIIRTKRQHFEDTLRVINMEDALSLLSDKKKNQQSTGTTNLEESK